MLYACNGDLKDDISVTAQSMSKNSIIHVSVRYIPFLDPKEHEFTSIPLAFKTPEAYWLNMSQNNLAEYWHFINEAVANPKPLVRASRISESELLITCNENAEDNAAQQRVMEMGVNEILRDTLIRVDGR